VDISACGGKLHRVKQSLQDLITKVCYLYTPRMRYCIVTCVMGALRKFVNLYRFLRVGYLFEGMLILAVDGDITVREWYEIGACALRHTVREAARHGMMTGAHDQLPYTIDQLDAKKNTGQAYPPG